MSNAKLNTLKNIINDTKGIFDLVSNELQDKVDIATNTIQQVNVNYLDLTAHINTWYSVIIESENYEQLGAFIPLGTINNTINNFNNIKSALTNFQTNFNIQHLINASFGDIFETSKSYMLHFLPYVKGNLNEAIKKITHFSKEKEAINSYLNETKKLYTNFSSQEKEITEFYNALKQNNDPTADDKRGIRRSIEDSYSQIKQQHHELFTAEEQVKIGDTTVPIAGKVNVVRSIIEDIQSKHNKIESETNEKVGHFISNIERSKHSANSMTREIELKKREIEDLKNNFSIIFKDIGETKKSYENEMESQRGMIEKMNSETKKSLGNHINALMVRTFREEAVLKEKEARFMFKCSIGFIAAIAVFGLIWILGFNMDGVELYQYGIRFIHDVNNINKKLEWITFAYRAMIFLPLGLGFWFCNKRHDVCSLLAAEYRYKRSIVEAMIGYRANYETSEGSQFTSSFAQEYTKFFDKTFEEINKNPAEKINKMLMKNKFLVEALVDKALDSRRELQDKKKS